MLDRVAVLGRGPHRQPCATQQIQHRGGHDPAAADNHRARAAGALEGNRRPGRDGPPAATSRPPALVGLGFRSMILAIDQGTTGTTCLVFDETLELEGRAYREFEQFFPRPGWVEHDAAEIWEVSMAVAREALEEAGVAPQDLAAIGITNQRETVVAWDPDTGEPLHRALVWQDRRTAARCDELKRAGHEDLVRERAGLVLDPYFSGTKIEWLLQNVDGLRERARSGRAVFGTIDAWLIFKLTGERVT